MPYFASNNGLTIQWHSATENYQAGSGEQNMGDILPTSGQLSAVFPGYGAAVASLQASSMCDQVDAFRDARLAIGFADTAAGNTGKTWPCDPVSKGNWVALASTAQPWALGLVTANPPTFAPWGADNAPLTMTAAQVYALFAQRVMPWVTLTYAYGNTMKAAIRAGSPPADITQGWP